MLETSTTLLKMIRIRFCGLRGSRKNSGPDEFGVFNFFFTHVNKWKCDRLKILFLYKTSFLSLELLLEMKQQWLGIFHCEKHKCTVSKWRGKYIGGFSLELISPWIKVKIYFLFSSLPKEMDERLKRYLEHWFYKNDTLAKSTITTHKLYIWSRLF